MKLLVCVEGLIGVGKSTLLDRMQKDSESNEYLRASILKEPVDEWRAVKVANTNMLQAMYDGQLPSSIFQLSILQSRYATLVRELCMRDVDVIVSERGPWSEKHVFAKSNLDADAFACYQYAHSNLTTNLLPLGGPIKVLFLHLKLAIPSVRKRIAARQRPEEAGIEAAYLETLEAAHVAMARELVTPAALGSDAIVDVKHVDVDASVTESKLAATVWKAILDAWETLEN